MSITEGNELPYYTIICPRTNTEINILKSIPKEWLHITEISRDILRCSGPIFCNNCKYHGMINNVWVGYCVNCAVYRYNNKGVQEKCGFFWPGRQYIYRRGQCIYEVTDKKDKWDDYLKLYDKELEIEKIKEINNLKNIKKIPPKTVIEYQKLIDLKIISWDEGSLQVFVKNKKTNYLQATFVSKYITCGNGFCWPGRQYIYHTGQCIDKVTDKKYKWDDYLKLYDKVTDKKDKWDEGSLKSFVNDTKANYEQATFVSKYITSGKLLSQ